MQAYSPKRRTALVFTGTGIAGAYHAGVLKALDESGVKIDVIVGSGAGTVAAVFGAVAGGSKLYGSGGFWDVAGWSALFRLRPALRVALLLLSCSLGALALPLVLSVIVGLLSPLLLVADMVLPGRLPALWPHIEMVWQVARAPYLTALIAPLCLLVGLGSVALLRAFFRDRRRLGEVFEWLIDGTPGRARIRDALSEITRGAALALLPGTDAELGRRYAALAVDNLGEPGFRELILRTLDLETGRVLPCAILRDEFREAFLGVRSGARRGPETPAGREAVDLRHAEYGGFVLPAVLTGLWPALLSPNLRVTFPKNGLYGGQTHRLVDATLAGGCGMAEALAAGAEQIIVAAAVPEQVSPLTRRRGPRAQLNALFSARERQSFEHDLNGVLRLNRMIATLGHATEDGGRGWEDPETGRLYRRVAAYVVRPRRRALAPLDFDGTRDPVTEVVESPGDLQEQGYRDAYRAFIEPVVGAAATETPAGPRLQTVPLSRVGGE